MTTATLRRLATGTMLAAMLAGSVACGPIDRLRAKDTLNEGVREFNKGHYDIAQQKFESALSLDPDNENAKLFYAMTLNAQLRRQASEDLGMKTIDAYQKVIDSNPDDSQKEKSYAYIADVYKQMADSLDASTEATKVQEYRDKRREWLLKRSEIAGATAETKSQMLYAVGQSYWEEANTIVRAATKPSPDPTKPPTYDLPDPQRAKVNDLIGKGHDYMRKAVDANAKYADAYAYQKILYGLQKRIETDPKKAEEYAKLEREKEDKFREVNSANQAEQAAAAAAEPAPAAK